MLVSSPTIRGPLPKITPVLVSALRSLDCKVVTELWGRHTDGEPLPRKVCGRALDIVRVRRALSEERFDIAVVHTTHEWASLSRDIPLLLATRRRCPKVALELHGSLSGRLVAPGSRLFKAVSGLLMRLSDATLVLSTEEFREWRRFHPSGRFYVVSNPFTSCLDSSVSPAERPCPAAKGTPTVLFVGRLMEEKGIFDLLAAFARTLQRSECHLLVVGTGPQEREVRERVQALGLRDHVTLAGYLEGEQLEAAYRSAQMLALPTYWKEGFPTVIVEAMNAGLPVVTTRIRGAADHLVEGVHVLFVPQRDPLALSEILVQLMDDPALRARMGQANREKVKEFAPEVVARQYLRVLEDIVQSSGAVKMPVAAGVLDVVERGKE